MNIEHYTIAMLARAMWRAGFRYTREFDPIFAELFGHIIRNRVIWACGQIGWLQAVNAAESPEGILEIDRPEDPRFLKILWEAERLYLNQSPDKIDGAVQYSDLALPHRAPIMTAAISTGRRISFYRSPGGEK